MREIKKRVILDSTTTIPGFAKPFIYGNTVETGKSCRGLWTGDLSRREPDLIIQKIRERIPSQLEK